MLKRNGKVNHRVPSPNRGKGSHGQFSVVRGSVGRVVINAWLHCAPARTLHRGVINLVGLGYSGSCRFKRRPGFLVSSSSDHGAGFWHPIVPSNVQPHDGTSYLSCAIRAAQHIQEPRPCPWESHRRCWCFGTLKHFAFSSAELRPLRPSSPIYV